MYAPHEKQQVTELDQTIYKLTLRPWDGSPVSVWFAYALTPKGWFPHLLQAKGPQVNGIDLDETFVRVAGIFWSYREFLSKMLYQILQTYGDKPGLERDYKVFAALGKSGQYVNLDIA